MCEYVTHPAFKRFSEEVKGLAVPKVTSAPEMATKRKLAATTTITVAGALLGISRHRSYESARAGEIPTVRFGAAIRVPLGRLGELLGMSVEEVRAAIDVLADSWDGDLDE